MSSRDSRLWPRLAPCCKYRFICERLAQIKRNKQLPSLFFCETSGRIPAPWPQVFLFIIIHSFAVVLLARRNLSWRVRAAIGVRFRTAKTATFKPFEPHAWHLTCQKTHGDLRHCWSIAGYKARIEFTDNFLPSEISHRRMDD